MGSLSPRDRRALMLLGAAFVLFLVLQYGLPPRSGGGASSTPTPVLETRLRRLQQIAQQKPRAQAEADIAARELAELEKGLLKSATPALALAEMQQIMKDLLSAQGIALQASEFGAVKAVGEDYAQVPLTVAFHCGIEQWINWMTALRNAPQILSTVDLRLSSHDQKNKTIAARVVVAGYIPAALAGAAKGPGGAP